MKRFLLLLAVLPFVMGACSKDDPAPEIPEDADDNFITAVVMTVGGISYTAEIAENVITVTVPYTVSLNNAQVTFEYTPSAKIMPDPATITDWDNERIFRVTSYNGAANEYTYKVVKDEIRHEGDVELKTPAEVAAFAATDATVIKGDLIIGSDADDAAQITDISALSLLKEVEGDIIIRSSFNGADLTGLGNITAIGGLQIGTAEALATNADLNMVSMESLEKVTGDILVRNNQVAYIQFDKLAAVGGSAVFNSAALQTFDFPKLATVGANLVIEGTTEDEKAGGEIVALEFPALTAVGGEFGINNLAKLISISVPKITEAGSINFASIPIQFETLTIPELSVVNGDLLFEANYVKGDFATSTANNKLTGIDGLANLTVVKGTLTIANFQVLETLPDWSKLTKLGGIMLYRLSAYYNKTLDLSNVDFEAFNGVDPTIEITYLTNIGKLITKEDMSHVNIILSANTDASVPGQPVVPELNFKSVKDFSYSNASSTDPVFTFEKVYGNMYVTRSTRQGFSAPNLTSIAGYLHIKIAMMASNLDCPKLETIGGQFFIEGNLNYAAFKYDFSKLKTVGCAENPQYAKEGLAANDILYGAFDIRGMNKDFAFPSLERVGGVGLTVHALKSFSCPALQTIDGVLSVDMATTLTALDMPNLAKISGVKFFRCTKFADFTMFGPFIKDGQIKEGNWSVLNCGYNPTYQDMVNGYYTKELNPNP